MKALIFLVCGLCLLAGAIWSGLSFAQFLREAARAPGRVVALNAGGSPPQIIFALPDGRRVSYPQGGWIGGYKVDDAVTVHYRVNAPTRTATVDAVGALWTWPIACAVLGALFTLLGIVNRAGGR